MGILSSVGAVAGDVHALSLENAVKALYRVYKQYNYKALRKMIAFLQ